MTDGIDDFVLWCFDIAQYVGDGVTYHQVSDPLGAERASLLNRLFSSYYDKVDTTTEGAAFQVAVWEIVYENLAGPLSVDDGLFTAWNNADVVDQANSWLAEPREVKDYRDQLLPVRHQPGPADRGARAASGRSCFCWRTGLGALVVARRRRKTV
jgi:hypothetical protein